MLERILDLYKGTDVVAPVARGLNGKFIDASGDCNCVDCGSDSDCSNCD